MKKDKPKKNNLKKKLPNIIFGLIFIAGLGIFLYPSVSNYINSRNQSRAISNYEEMVNSISEEDYSKMWSEARAYNEELAKKPLNFELSDEEREEYNSILNVSGTGIIGYIEIENIGDNLKQAHEAMKQQKEKQTTHTQQKKNLCPFNSAATLGAECGPECALYGPAGCRLKKDAQGETKGRRCPFLRECSELCAMYNHGCTL